jgi:transposase InsO family protein
VRTISRWKLPLRRACALLCIARSSARYASKREVIDAPAVKRMRELAAQYPPYGYRRIGIFLGRDGHRMGVDRAHRLWRMSRLQVPRKRPRRRIASSRPRPMLPTGPNHVWAYDFVFDACADGKLSDPGKPWQNGTDEGFNEKFRDECLSMEYFRSRPEAVATIETWRKHYNGVRPHSSLDDRTPNEFKRDCRYSGRETRGATSK